MTLLPGLNPGLSEFWRTNKFGQIPRKKSCSIQSVMDTVSPDQTRCDLWLIGPRTRPLLFFAAPSWTRTEPGRLSSSPDSVPLPGGFHVPPHHDGDLVHCSHNCLAEFFNKLQLNRSCFLSVSACGLSRQ
ncbi:hypothetical protein AMECASPLE_034304 [Ameca splendens]|uniref:Uncharacterized protein n=1 Tax=Ameca splendens TaxID=208324 RepID=A0ABV0Z5Q4_9TELE